MALDGYTLVTYHGRFTPEGLRTAPPRPGERPLSEVWVPGLGWQALTPVDP